MVRKKQRYLIGRLQYIDDEINAAVTREDILYSIRESIKDLYGDYGVGAYSVLLFVCYSNPYTGVFFLQCPRDNHKQIRTCLTFVKMVRRVQCVMTCIHMTATIKSAEKYLLEYNKKKMKIVYEKCKTPQEKREVLQFMKEVNIAHVITDVV